MVWHQFTDAYGYKVVTDITDTIWTPSKYLSADIPELVLTSEVAKEATPKKILQSFDICNPERMKQCFNGYRPLPKVLGGRELNKIVARFDNHLHIYFYRKFMAGGIIICHQIAGTF